MQEVFCAVSSTFLYSEAIRSALTYPLDSDLSVGKRIRPLYNWVQMCRKLSMVQLLIFW